MFNSNKAHPKDFRRLAAFIGLEADGDPGLAGEQANRNGIRYVEKTGHAAALDDLAKKNKTRNLVAV